MPTIINPYGNSKTMGDDLFGLGGIADAFFGPKASQSALYREKFREAARQNEYTPLLAENVRRLGLPGGNVNAALSDAIMSGTPINEITAANLAATTNANPSTLGGNVVTAAALGAKVPYGSTVAGTTAHLDSTAAIDREKTNRLILADEQKTARTPVTVFDPTSPTGTKTIFMSDLQTAAPGTYNVVPSQDTLKAATAARYLLPPAAPPAVTAAPLPSLGLSPDNPLTGIMSVPAFGGAPAAPTAPAAPSIMSGPLQHYLGADPKINKGRNWVIQNAVGEEIAAGVTPDEGYTDLSGNKIVVPPGHRLRLLDAANPAALGSATGPAKEIRESRIATATTLAQIDDLQTTLKQKGAAVALGPIGQGAVIANNLRSQIDALTGTARELGYGSYADKFETGAKRYVDANPGLAQWAQKNGITRGILESQISGLSYANARANQGPGPLSDLDIERSLKDIGANMHDPVAFSAVLDNLKGRVKRRQEITERVTATTVTRDVGNALRLNQPTDAGATPGATAAPGVTPPPGFVLD